MTSKVYVVTDLGPGDGGKGGVVHKISTMMRAHTIIKRGGAQGSHGVSTSKGQQFAFSQWGCGTFEGILTHLSDQMVIAPEGLLNEAEHLRYLHGIYDPFRLLTVDEQALCATPFHGIASRIKELSRGAEPRGTVGTGVGEAYRAFRRCADESIVARDLRGSELRDKLAHIRHQIQTDLQYVIEYDFLPEDRATLAEEVGMLHDDRFLDYVVKRFELAAERTNIVSHDYLGDAILSREGVAVVETSHGILTDREAGFHPHTSAIRTLPRFTHRLLSDAGYDGQVVNLGVTRAYAVRHGAGPLPTTDPAMVENILPGSAKEENRYQGSIRVGPLDFVLLRYAIEACGGPAAFDGLAITWFDQVRANGVWQMANAYDSATDSAFFTPSGGLRLDHGTGPGHLEYQAALGRALLDCSPRITNMAIDQTASNDVLYDTCAVVMQDSVAVPVRMVSFGPTEIDKLCK